MQFDTDKVVDIDDTVRDLKSSNEGNQPDYRQQRCSKSFARINNQTASNEYDDNSGIYENKN